VIPQTRQYETYILSNSIIDSYVVIPFDLDQWSIVGVQASYGETSAADDVIFQIEIRNTNFIVGTTINYTHPQETRNYAFAVSPAVLVTQGQTINVNIQSGGAEPEGSRGYTVTLTLEEL
jgi:hypothetical protein